MKNNTILWVIVGVLVLGGLIAVIVVFSKKKDSTIPVTTMPVAPAPTNIWGQLIGGLFSGGGSNQSEIDNAQNR